MLNRTQPSAAPRNPTSLAAAVFSTSLPPQLYNSEAARLASGPHSSDILQQMQSLARSFEAEKLNKERDVLEAKATLTSIHTEVNDAGRTLRNLDEQMKPLEAKQGELDGLVEKLKAKIETDLARGARQWKASDEGREQRWKNGDDPAQAGEDYADLPALTEVPADAEAEEERLRGEIEKMRQRRGELVNRLVKAQTEVS
jgi:chromosome segregation ATPase